MSDYVPPFTISNTMLELVSEISEKVGRINSHKELENKRCGIFVRVYGERKSTLNFQLAT